MAEWIFERENKCDLFYLHSVHSNIGDTCHFNVGGDIVDGLVKVPNVPILVEGTDTTYYTGFEPWYADENNCHICPHGNGQKQVVPGGLAQAITTSDNTLYVCLTGIDGKKIDYDYSKGAITSYTTQYDNTYIVILRGTATINGSELKRWDIARKAQAGEITFSNVSDNAYIVYAWERI